MFVDCGTEERQAINKQTISMLKAMIILRMAARGLILTHAAPQLRSNELFQR